MREHIPSEEELNALVRVYLSLTTVGQMRAIQALKNIEDECKKPTYSSGNIIQFPTDRAKRPLPCTPSQS